ncbi:hypothetical protein FMUBM48_07780 [Nocardia cyriacigeorgica]|nr:hypothetical protein FMUBM48_07780 [Nocardia cyriacigeorgica]
MEGRVQFAHMFDMASEYSAVRWVDPPIDVQLDLGQLWSPSRVRWAATVALWVRANGASLYPVPGRLVELITTRAGDLIGRVQCVVTVDQRPSAEVLLAPWGTWAPADAANADRLRQLVIGYGPNFNRLLTDSTMWPSGP